MRLYDCFSITSYLYPPQIRLECNLSKISAGVVGADIASCCAVSSATLGQLLGLESFETAAEGGR